MGVSYEQRFLKENTFQINYYILFGILFPTMISTKGLFLVPLTFVNNLVTYCSCKCCELAPFVWIPTKTGPNYRIILYSLFSEGLFIWYKASIGEGYLLVCSFWDWCSLPSGSFQECTSELVNHLLPWMNSTVISSRCQMDRSKSGCHDVCIN